MEKLDRYFEKCIEDAYKAEEREYKLEKVNWTQKLYNGNIEVT